MALTSSQANKDAITRLSASSAGGLTKVDDQTGYTAAKTPDQAQELEGGALRPGGVPNIYSKEHIGILIQYAGLGIVIGVIYDIVYPLLNNYLRMSGVAQASTNVLTNAPWTLKVVFGMFSDCFPIFGYRRRPYMILGWVICGICMLVSAVLPLGEPYYPDPKLAFLPVESLTQAQVDSINEDAPDRGTAYIVLIFIANIGLALSFASTNGMMVELAQREPEAIRGRLQTMNYVIKSIFDISASCLVGFGLNSSDFGGSFGGDVGVGAVYGICAAVSVVTAAAGWFFVTEEKHEKRSIREECSKLYKLMQQRVIYQVTIFRFFNNLFRSVSVTANNPIQSVWAGVEPINSSIASILGSLIAAISLYSIQRWGLQWSWRTVIIVMQVMVVSVDVIPVMFTTWDVFRSQWFWLGLPLLENIPNKIVFIVTMYCMVEVIDVGNEAMVYGLIESCSTLALPFATVITKAIDQNFDIARSDLQRDDTAVHYQVTYVYVIAYAFQLFCLVFVVLLPRQKAEAQALKRNGSSNKLIGTFVGLATIFLFVWSISTNLLSIFPSTACLRVAGGNGC